MLPLAWTQDNSIGGCWTCPEALITEGGALNISTKSVALGLVKSWGPASGTTAALGQPDLPLALPLDTH